MNKTNQVLLSITLVSALLGIYLSVGWWALNLNADAECMRYKVPQAQIVNLTTYCGGMLNGSDVYIPLSLIKQKYGEK